jgi:hypothetical protein
MSTKLVDEKNSTKVNVDKNLDIRKKRINSSKKSTSLDGVTADETNNNNNNNSNNNEEKISSPKLKID